MPSRSGGRRQPGQEALDGGRTVDDEPGAFRARGRGDCDAGAAHGVKRVLIGDVVAEIHGQRISGARPHALEDPLNGIPLVPRDRWQQLDDARPAHLAYPPRFHVRAGDLVAFPAGTGICHTFINDGDREALLLSGGESAKSDSRIYYPMNPERKGDMPWSSWWDDVPERPRGAHPGKPSRRQG